MRDELLTWFFFLAIDIDSLEHFSNHKLDDTYQDSLLVLIVIALYGSF